MLLHPHACSHQLQQHRHTLPSGKADIVTSIHQTLVTLATNKHTTQNQLFERALIGRSNYLTATHVAISVQCMLEMGFGDAWQWDNAQRIC